MDNCQNQTLDSSDSGRFTFSSSCCATDVTKIRNNDIAVATVPKYPVAGMRCCTAKSGPGPKYWALGELAVGYPSAVILWTAPNLAGGLLTIAASPHPTPVADSPDTANVMITFVPPTPTITASRSQDGDLTRCYSLDWNSNLWKVTPANQTIRCEGKDLSGRPHLPLAQCPPFRSGRLLRYGTFQHRLCF